MSIDAFPLAHYETAIEAAGGLYITRPYGYLHRIEIQLANRLPNMDAADPVRVLVHVYGLDEDGKPPAFQVISVSEGLPDPRTA